MPEESIAAERSDTEVSPAAAVVPRQLLLGEDLDDIDDGAAPPGKPLGPVGGVRLVMGESLQRRRVPRGTWKVGTPVCALLVTSGRLDRGQEPTLVGLARVQARRPGGGKSEQLIDISDVALLRAPHPWVQVLDRLSQPERARLDNNLQGAPEALFGASATRLIAAVASETGTFIREWIDEALRHTSSTFNEGDLDRMDRRATVLRVANMAGASETQVSVDEVPRSLRSRWEGDFIKHDSRVVDPRWRRSDVADTWFLFEKDGRRLYVLESHTRQAEQATGGDLIYLRSRPATMVVVQYKRLTTSSLRVTDASCPIDDRFRDQLRRLITLPTAHLDDREFQSATREPAVAMDFRLSPACGFVKLIESRETATEGHLYRGLYLPAEYVQLLLAEAKKGVVELDLRQDRFIDTQTFVQLVSEGWIGTSASTTLELTKRLHASGFMGEDQPHTIAEEIPPSK